MRLKEAHPLDAIGMRLVLAYCSRSGAWSRFEHGFEEEGVSCVCFSECK